MIPPNIVIVKNAVVLFHIYLDIFGSLQFYAIEDLQLKKGKLTNKTKTLYKFDFAALWISHRPVYCQNKLTKQKDWILERIIDILRGSQQ